uniref:AA_permease_C domain-containing protein n=1 Tax=Panagrellus redivivus TaxID=6233 RepID=A0A7E4UV32_PANRE
MLRLDWGSVRSFLLHSFPPAVCSFIFVPQALGPRAVLLVVCDVSLLFRRRALPFEAYPASCLPSHMSLVILVVRYLTDVMVSLKPNATEGDGLVEGTSARDAGLSPTSCQKIGKPYNDGKEGALERNVGLADAIGMILGCIIGSGIFVSPAGVQAQAGSLGVSLIIWAVAGLFVIAGSFVYIELGLLLRESGGDYAYIIYAFGDFVGFLRLWIEAVVVRPCTCTIVAITFAVYCISPFVDENDDTAVLQVVVAACMIIFQTALNSLSIRTSLALNNICTVAKLGALVGLIGAGVYALAAGIPHAYDSFQEPFADTNTNPGSIAMGFYSALFAYQGWNYLNFIVEEVKNPVFTLPVAVIVSSVAIIIVYVLCNVAYYTGLRPAEMLTVKATAIEFANRVTGWKGAGIFMCVMVAISCFGSGNGVIYTSSRLFYVGARNEHFPKFLIMTNPTFRTPIPSVIATGVLSLAYLALSDNAITLINYIAISYWLAIAFATASLFYYRLKIPREEYPFRTFLPVAIFFFVGCCILVLFPFYSNWKEALIGLGIMSTGIPVYALFVKWRPAVFDKASDAITRIVQIVFLVSEPVDPSKKNDDHEMEEKADVTQQDLKASALSPSTENDDAKE